MRVGNQNFVLSGLILCTSDVISKKVSSDLEDCVTSGVGAPIELAHTWSNIHSDSHVNAIEPIHTLHYATAGLHIICVLLLWNA